MTISVKDDETRAYLTLLQGVISRLASNSANCKSLCVTLVSAMIVLVIDKNKPQAILVGLFPICLFFLLDAYYLSLERDYRNCYNAFVEKLHDEKAEQKDVYKLKLLNSGFTYRLQAIIGAIFSLSVVPFYGTLAIALFITKLWVAS